MYNVWRRRMWQQPTKEEKKTLTLNLVYELPTVGRYLHKDSHYTSTLNDQVIQSEASHSRRRHFPRQPRSTTFCLSRISTLSSCRKQKRRWENVNKITMPTRNQFRFIFILFSSHITMMRCFTFYLSQFIVHWHCCVRFPHHFVCCSASQKSLQCWHPVQHRSTTTSQPSARRRRDTDYVQQVAFVFATFSFLYQHTFNQFFDFTKFHRIQEQKKYYNKM